VKFPLDGFQVDSSTVNAHSSSSGSVSGSNGGVAEHKSGSTPTKNHAQHKSHKTPQKQQQQQTKQMAAAAENGNDEYEDDYVDTVCVLHFVYCAALVEQRIFYCKYCVVTEIFLCFVLYFVIIGRRKQEEQKASLIILPIVTMPPPWTVRERPAPCEKRLRIACNSYRAWYGSFINVC
jgi:hypothetical protein